MTTRTQQKKEKKSDWRLTNQRMVILEYLRETPGHHGADHIYSVVKKKMPTISFATVYRNLNFLRDHGYIKEAVVNKIGLYEGQIDAHVHLLCEVCGRISNIVDDQVFKSLKHLAQTQKFQSRMEQVEIRGICDACRAQGRKLAVGQGRCEACGKLKKDILDTVLLCSDCRFNASCVYYQEAYAAKHAS
ncbi:MAG: Fur family transcriptional regulator [Patescibacteria group bacterium]